MRGHCLSPLIRDGRARGLRLKKPDIVAPQKSAE